MNVLHGSQYLMAGHGGRVSACPVRWRNFWRLSSGWPCASSQNHKVRGAFVFRSQGCGVSLACIACIVLFCAFFVNLCPVQMMPAEALATKKTLVLRPVSLIAHPSRPVAEQRRCLHLCDQDAEPVRMVATTGPTGIRRDPTQRELELPRAAQ